MKKFFAITLVLLSLTACKDKFYPVDPNPIPSNCTDDPQRCQQPN